MALQYGPHQLWWLDFACDAFGYGRRFRILCLVHDFMHECLALVPDTSLLDARGARELDKIAVSSWPLLATMVQS